MKNKFAAVLLILFVFSIFSFSVYKAFKIEDNILITVTDKAVKRSNGSDIYLIFTENETFECTDSVIDWKFNSSDFYGRLKVGETYRVSARGMRIPFMSTYRNIISVR